MAIEEVPLSLCCSLTGEEIDMEIGERSCTSKAPLLADTQLETQSARSSLVLWTAVLQCLKAADAEKARHQDCPFLVERHKNMCLEKGSHTWMHAG